MKLALHIQIVRMYAEQSQEGFQAEVWESVAKTPVHTSQALRPSRRQRLPSHHKTSPPRLLAEMLGF